VNPRDSIGGESFDQRLAAQLKDLDQQALRRRLPDPPAPNALNFSSNDYLDLARDPQVVAAAHAALDAFGVGSTASRLVCGSLPPHTELEAAIAASKGTEAALVFGSGYLTACGIFSALTSRTGRHDTVVADKLVHACVIDAVKLSGAKLMRFRHNDVEHAEEQLARVAREAQSGGSGSAILVTESVFSMDGDRAPLDELRSVAAQYGARFMVDEAHSAGILPSARADILMGTLSKSYGGYGGYVAGSRELCAWLVNRARSFIYTTAPPPATMAAATVAIKLARDGRGVALLERAAAFRSRLHHAGLDTGASASQIVPVMIGDNQRALDLATRLRERGIHVVAIRPPTVPAGTARLRFSITLAHSASDLERAADVLIEEMEQA